MREITVGKTQGHFGHAKHPSHSTTKQNEFFFVIGCDERMENLYSFRRKIPLSRDVLRCMAVVLCWFAVSLNGSNVLAQPTICSKLTASDTPLDSAKSLNLTLHAIEELVRSGATQVTVAMLELASDQARLIDAGVVKESGIPTEIFEPEQSEKKNRPELPNALVAARAARLWLPHISDLKELFFYGQSLGRVFGVLDAHEEGRGISLNLMCRLEKMIPHQPVERLHEVVLLWSGLAGDFHDTHPDLTARVLDTMQVQVLTKVRTSSDFFRAVPPLMYLAKKMKAERTLNTLQRRADDRLQSVVLEAEKAQDREVAETVARIVEYAEAMLRHDFDRRARESLSRARAILKTHDLDEPLIEAEIVRVEARMKCGMGPRDKCWPR